MKTLAWIAIGIVLWYVATVPAFWWTTTPMTLRQEKQ